MKYTVEAGEFEKALHLDKAQETRLKNAIKKSYDQNWHKDGPNIDQIYFAMAPYIKTPEEAFYVATVIVSDVMGTMMELGHKFKGQ